MCPRAQRHDTHVELGGQPREICLEEAPEILRRLHETKLPENLPHDPRVRAPAEIDVGERTLDAEGIEQAALQGPQAGPAVSDQCAIDIPKNEAFHVNRRAQRRAPPGTSEKQRARAARRPRGSRLAAA